MKILNDLLKSGFNNKDKEICQLLQYSKYIFLFKLKTCTDILFKPPSEILLPDFHTGDKGFFNEDSWISKERKIASRSTFLLRIMRENYGKSLQGVSKTKCLQRGF